MVQEPLKDKTACVVGLGYVGLPLAEAFAQKITTIGYEIVEDKARHISETTKVPLHVTSDPTEIKKADFISICVPTPVKKTKEPDLYFVESAARIIGQNLKPGAIVVLESTVYPGVTEEIVRPILEQESGLICGKDFKVGYSPERINPGDEAHELAKITKIVAGMDAESGDILAELYSLITTVYRAPDIRTAEAAKVIENIQRDLNIALMNELALIFERMDIDVMEVIRAASTKWNFNVYYPGPGVGGHCLPVDPYYLVYKAQELGYHPQIILAGRRVNDTMPLHVLTLIIDGLNEAAKPVKGSRILILGASYKANAPDLRESPSKVLVREILARGADVSVAEPHCESGLVFGCPVVSHLSDNISLYDAIVYMVDHDVFKNHIIRIIGGMKHGAVFVDGKRGVDPEMIQQFDVIYRGIGYSNKL